MVDKKILLLSTYPIVQAQTGGPLRVKALYESYRKHFSSVKHVGVFSKYHQPDNYAPTDIPVKGALAEATRLAPNTSDYLIGVGIEKDQTLHDEVVKMLLDYRPDVIEIEQVFPYIGLRTILKELPFRPKLVHSSHNVEYLMKREILENLDHDQTEIESIVASIKEAEEAICAAADLVTAVTKDDGQAAIAMGATNYILARNGVNLLTTSDQDKQYWRKYLEAHSIDTFAVFIGSAHPPNMKGFLTMVGTGMGFLPKGHAIILAGSVGDNVMGGLKADSAADVTCHRRLFSVGRQSTTRLHSLIELASAILLPITEGGGSNLKTAEALVSLKPIVATSKALRSFEEYRQFPTIILADSPATFRQSIRQALDVPSPALSRQEVELTEQLYWDNTLRDLMVSVAEL